jgi:prolyl 4-hydroxylase
VLIFKIIIAHETGQCHENPDFMNTTCAPVCETCEQLSYEYRCPIDKTAPKALNHIGDLDRLFERILQGDEFERFAPSILSSPNNAKKGPWVVQLDRFASVEECDRLIRLGGEIGYAASLTLGTTHPNGGNRGRTSTSAWLTHEQCEADSLVSSLLDRVETLLGIPKNNTEHVQLLRYEESQFYGQHHDYLPHHKKQPQVHPCHYHLFWLQTKLPVVGCGPLSHILPFRHQGVRILTLFLYLNDVEDGGETRFPNLGIVVTPKRGRAVLWPSTLNEAPDIKDFRTEHEALAVKRGIKYASNVWVHQGNYRQARETNCI